MNKNPFYEVLKGYIPKILLGWVILICIEVIMPCVNGIRNIMYDGSGMVFINRTSTMWYSMVFVITIAFINIIFSKMLDIRGDRESIIKAFFKVILILTIICILSGLVSEFIMEFICKLCSIQAEFYTRISTIEWLGKGMDNILIILLVRLINSFFIMSIGYTIGAVFYRLKAKYNILVFLIIPSVFLGLATYVGFFTKYLHDILVPNLWDFGVTIYHRPITCIILEILLSYFFIVVGNKFLNKAPIAEYAHDIA